MEAHEVHDAYHRALHRETHQRPRRPVTQARAFPLDRPSPTPERDPAPSELLIANAR